MNRIEKNYNQNPEKEWMRLQETAYDTIEATITKKFLHKYLKPNFKIADIGCGPGIYSIWLLENGYEVLLSDLSEGNLDLAKKKIAEINPPGKIIDFLKADATQLKQIESNQFDLTLLFGPIYHLLDEKKRIAAIQEATRITKPGGYIFVSTINRLCPFLAMLHRSPEYIVNELTNDPEELDRILNSGCYENFEESPNAFTDAYFAKSNEVPEIFKTEGIDLVESFGCEGISAYLYDKAEVIHKHSEAWKKFIEILYQHSQEPSTLGMSEHVVYVGQKPEAVSIYPYQFTDNVLVPVHAEHAPLLFPLIHNTKITDTILWDGPENLESYISAFKQRQKQVMKKEIYMFTIFSKGEACGSCSIRPEEDQFKADIGLWISEKASGQGLGTKVVQELTEFGFNFLNLQRIEAYVFEGNLASRKIFEKNNFLLEGTLRQACKKRGHYLNEWLFAITKDEYQKNKL